MTSAYLDNNSTTVIHPAVAEVMNECYAAGFVNPASQHAAGRRARKALEEARESVGEILGARQNSSQSDRVVFTSGATEANNLALFGQVEMIAAKGEGRPRIAVSTIEHPSVLEAAQRLASPAARIPCEVLWIPAGSDGVADMDHLLKIVAGEATRPHFVALMLANNETGVIQPIAKAVEICSEFDVPVHTDAVQSIGRTAVSFQDLNVASLTLTAHKLHGPRGIGALLLRHDQQLAPVTFGGSQQLGTRPGTESVALAVGMATALQIWRDEQAARLTHMTTLRDRLEEQLRSAIPTIVINGAAAERLPHTSNVSFPGLDRQAMLLALDRSGVACSTGSACTSGSSEPSHVLIGMGCSEAIIGSALRFSLASTTTAEEVDFAAAKIVEIHGKMSTFSA